VVALSKLVSPLTVRAVTLAAGLDIHFDKPRTTPTKFLFVHTFHSNNLTSTSLQSRLGMLLHREETRMMKL